MLSSKFIGSVWHIGLQYIFRASAVEKIPFGNLGFIFFIFNVPQKNLSFESDKYLAFYRHVVSDTMKSFGMVLVSHIH